MDKNRTDNAFCLVLCTCPASCAPTLSRSLVDAKLAACVNMLAGVQSTYRWDQEVLQDEEHLLIIKTQKNKLEQLEHAIAEQHPYDVPEIIEVPMQSAHRAYWQWMASGLD